MDTYDLVLFLHLLSLFLMAGGITVFGVCYLRLRAARSLDAAVPWVRLTDQAGLLFPVSILGLLATGAYLTTHAWTWSTPWIEVSIAGLILVALQGPLVGGPRTEALKRALNDNGPGALADPARRLTRDPALWIVIVGNPGIVLGIVWNMTVKPGTAGAIAAILIGYAIGAAAGLALSARPATGP
jgi:hypothetical protein